MTTIEENLKQYIVPIFHDDEFLGTGFICNSVLITAKHVLYQCDKTEGTCGELDPTELTFVFKDVDCHILSCLYHEHEVPDNRRCNKYLDLAVLKTELVEIDGIVLANTLEPYDENDAKYIGFQFDEETKVISSFSCQGILHLHSYLINNSSVVIYRNTLVLAEASGIEKGMSGGPVFVRDTVVGMLVSKSDDLNYCRLVSAHHIAGVLANI